MIFLIIVNNSCVKKKLINGHLPDPELLSIVKIGSDNKKKVLQILGAPSFHGEFGDNSLYYSQTINTKFAFLDPKILDHKIIQVEFDKQDILQNIYLFNEDDRKKISMSKNYTVTHGTEISFFEQMMSNFGMPGLSRKPNIGSGRAAD